MSSNSNTGNAQDKARKQVKTLLEWLLIGVVLLMLAGLLLPTVSRPPRDKLSRTRMEVLQIQGALEIFTVEYGQYPTGETAAIFRALRGENPRQILFFNANSNFVSADGGVLDPWRTPYRIYFSSNAVFVRSAGPNKRFDAAGEKGFDDFIEEKPIH